MEIPGNDIRINKNKTVQDRVDAAGKKSAQPKPEASPQVSGGEQIALSPKAKGIQKALETVKTSPDIRSEKVEAIKNQIASNTYQVDSEAIGQKILQQIIAETQFID